MAREIFEYVSVDGLTGFVADKTVDEELARRGYSQTVKRFRRFFVEDDGTLIVEISVPPSKEAIVTIRIGPHLWHVQQPH